MDIDEAYRVFAKYIQGVCPVCHAAPGRLCDTPSVWIHVDRMVGK